LSALLRVLRWGELYPIPARLPNRPWRTVRRCVPAAPGRRPTVPCS